MQTSFLQSSKFSGNVSYNTILYIDVRSQQSSQNSHSAVPQNGKALKKKLIKMLVGKLERIKEKQTKKKDLKYKLK